MLFFKMCTRKIYLLGILLLTLSHLSNELTIETSESPEPFEYNNNCDKVYFDKETYVRCTCLDGIWAVLIAHPSDDEEEEEERQWKIYGVNNECLHVGRWVTKIHKLADSAVQSTLSILPLTSSLHQKDSVGNQDSKEPAIQYVVTNNNNWQLIVMPTDDDDDKKKETICLPAAGFYKYCTYLVPTVIVQNFVEQQEILMGADCPSNSRRLEPVSCGDLMPQLPIDSDEEPLICNLIPPRTNNHVRRRRQEAVTGGPANPDNGNGTNVVTEGTSTATDNTADNTAADNTAADTARPLVPEEIDENYVTNPDLYAGDKTFMSSITHFIFLQVIKLSGLKKDKKMSDPVILPVSNLLRKSIQLMKKICNPIKDEVWDIALGAFLRHQKNILHLKEPYIGYAAYQRILNTLDTCIEQSRPIIFQENWKKVQKAMETNTDATICESDTVSAPLIKWSNGAFETFSTTNAIAYADPKNVEPLIETVWKAFVTTHSHCFKYFSNYYNDHHTYTVTIMPFFTNKIQDIWMKNKNATWQATEDDDNDYTTNNIWYGGLIGKSSKLYEDLDQCYGAARGAYKIPREYVTIIDDPGSKGYPWQFSRPQEDETNRWTRKKRDLDGDSRTIQMTCPLAQTK